MEIGSRTKTDLSNSIMIYFIVETAQKVMFHIITVQKHYKTPFKCNYISVRDLI